MIKLGSTNIRSMYLGGYSIGKAYLGSDLVYDKGSAPILPVFYDKLIFDGTAYITTDIMVPNDGCVTAQMGYETTKAVQCLFGQGDNTYYIVRGVFLNTNTSASARVFAARYNSVTAQTSTLAFSTTSYNLFLTPTKCGWGSTSFNVTKGSLPPTTGIFFGKNNGTTVPAYTGKLGIVRIYDSSAKNVTTYDGFSSYTPVATFRPCTYNGEAGLWYVEGNRFFGNSNTGGGTLSVSSDF